MSKPTGASANRAMRCGAVDADGDSFASPQRHADDLKMTEADFAHGQVEVLE